MPYPAASNETDPGHPLALALLFHDVPPPPVYQLPYSAAELNPAPGIKFWDDFGVQHAPAVQTPLQQAPVQQTPLQSVPESQSHPVPAVLQCLPVAQVLGQLPPHPLEPPHFPEQARVQQLPLPSQTMPLPQLVPKALLVLATHSDAPVEQEVAPFLHGLLGWHEVPAVQAMQLPLPLQTWLVPQVVPPVLLVVATHWDDPVEQEVAPFWHGLVGWHEVPAVQAPQVPLPSQTWLVPQVVPGALFVLATH